MKVQIKLKKVHPNKSMKCGEIWVSPHFEVHSVKKEWLETVEAKHWFEWKKVKSEKIVEVKSEDIVEVKAEKIPDKKEK